MLNTIQDAFFAVAIVRRNDQAASLKVRDSAAPRFRQTFGMDAEGLRLTDHGFKRV